MGVQSDVACTAGLYYAAQMVSTPAHSSVVAADAHLPSHCSPDPTWPGRWPSCLRSRPRLRACGFARFSLRALGLTAQRTPTKKITRSCLVRACAAQEIRALPPAAAAGSPLSLGTSWCTQWAPQTAFSCMTQVCLLPRCGMNMQLPTQQAPESSARLDLLLRLGVKSLAVEGWCL